MSLSTSTVDDLGRLAPLWDRAVDRTPDVDAFCSATCWSFAAATSFPQVEPPLIVGDGDSFCGLRGIATDDGGRVLVGMDPVWGFATPLVGPPMAAARALERRLAAERFDHAVITGQRSDSILTMAIVRVLDDRHRLLVGPTQERLQIDLGDGVDAWWARRSARFRQRMRRLRAEATDRGVSVEDLSAMEPGALFDRILAIESRSWKGRDATGLASAELASFYRQVSARLAATEQLRVLVARRDDTDVGFILGGVRGATYRGLQLSYVEDVAAEGIGHLLQLEQLERLPIEGVRVYDLGMDMEYKRRWADRIEETIAVIVAR